MFNKFKLLLVIIPLTIVGILFFQNQEPISLKILCADTSSQYCWYQTPTLPLAMWIGLFLIVGVIASLVWQLLQSLGSPQSSKNYDDQPFSPKEKSYSQKVSSPSATKTSRIDTSKSSSSGSEWEYSRQGEDWESEQSPSIKVNPKINNDDFVRESNFKTRQESQNIDRSGSTYSYQFEKNPKPQDKVKKNADEVYDANYRTINGAQSSQVNRNPDIDEDEEDWV